MHQVTGDIGDAKFLESVITEDVHRYVNIFVNMLVEYCC